MGSSRNDLSAIANIPPNQSTKAVAVILSGCGFRDGTEITEAVSALIALSQLQVNYKCFAPDGEFVVAAEAFRNDHRPERPAARLTEKRSILAESARIARGQVSDLRLLAAAEFDALVFPGGYGAAMNLCNWALKGAQCEVLPEVERVIKEFYQQNKCISAFCIAPVLLARVLGRKGITLTIGNDHQTAAEIEKTGAVHETCTVDDYVSDRSHKIVTTPAYMYEAAPHQVFRGIAGAITELCEMS